jgi:hypothetical protein
LRQFLIFLVHLASVSGLCQQQIITDVASTTNYEAGKTLIEKINQLTKSLEQKRSSSDVRFLRKVFYKTHHTFLKKYEAYSSLEQLVYDGQYDCLTATTVYSSVLEMLGFNFKIVETNYHIFILVKIADKEILLETTDRLNGFVTDLASINTRISTYKLNSPSLNKQKGKNFEYPFHLFKEVKRKDLVGLLYFNQAIKEFNKHNWTACLDLLGKSQTIYDSPRIKEISDLASLMMKPPREPQNIVTTTEMIPQN